MTRSDRPSTAAVAVAVAPHRYQDVLSFATSTPLSAPEGDQMPVQRPVLEKRLTNPFAWSLDHRRKPFSGSLTRIVQLDEVRELT